MKLRYKKTFLFIVGTRPEIIKIYPLINIIRKDNNFGCKVLFTNQHKTDAMSINFFKLFKIKIDYKIPYSSGTINDRYSFFIKNIGKILIKLKPDNVIVLGDTLSASAGAMSSILNKINVIYLESGLRTNDFNQPWPEEILRKTITQVAELHFVPTKFNKINLIREGVDPKKIFISGNTVIDSLLFILKKINLLKSNFTIKKLIDKLSKKNFVLITVHRRENHGKNLDKIILAIKILANSYKTIHFVIPVHPNPDVKNKIYKNLSKIKNVFLIKPLNYAEFIYLFKNCRLIISDSGGVQEECTLLRKRVLVLRNVTERPEALSKFLYLCGTNVNVIIRKFKTNFFKEFPKAEFIFGNGHSAKKIFQILKKLKYE
jgi:UDP-N-acetylglucosamine 2-epimerase (non-hydrolysing)